MCYVFINIIRYDSTGKSKQLSILHSPINLSPILHLKPTFNHRMPSDHPFQSIDPQEILENILTKRSYPRSPA